MKRTSLISFQHWEMRADKIFVVEGFHAQVRSAVVHRSGGVHRRLVRRQTVTSVQSQTQSGSGFAAVPGERGGWDLTGPYEVVRDWPKPLSQLPGHEQWTWGATEAVFAESRMQVFDENGKFVDQWPFNNPSSVNFVYANGDGAVWAFEDPTAKVVKYDREGHLLYAWGGLGDYPGGFLNMHGASVDPDGNLYVADGVIYIITGADDVFALSIKTGKPLWTHKGGLPDAIPTVCCGWTSRGVALGDGKVYVGQLDGRLMALDQQSGEPAWSIQAER